MEIRFPGGFVFSWLGVAALLAACGDGGGGSSSPADLASAPVASAINAYSQSNHSASLSGTTSSGTALTLDYSYTPNSGTVTFNGVAADSAVTTLTVLSGSSVVATATQTSYFTLNPYVPIGAVSSTGTPYYVVTASTALPSTVSVGQSGTLDTVSIYHDSTMTILDGNETQTWTASANDATTLLLCIDSAISGITSEGAADGLESASGSVCYTIDASGNATLVSATVTASGQSIAFQ